MLDYFRMRIGFESTTLIFFLYLLIFKKFTYPITKCIHSFKKEKNLNKLENSNKANWEKNSVKVNKSNKNK